ncbi:hypothetical protein J1614_009871 [Plenodomus biglobosus]|nr:hypothetical protein J1614_009871 [Plenodomus biglobosus]
MHSISLNYRMKLLSSVKGGAVGTRKMLTVFVPWTALPPESIGGSMAAALWRLGTRNTSRLRSVSHSLGKVSEVPALRHFVATINGYRESSIATCALELVCTHLYTKRIRNHVRALCISHTSSTTDTSESLSHNRYWIRVLISFDFHSAASLSDVQIGKVGIGVG